jgi:hypothetical protein
MSSDRLVISYQASLLHHTMFKKPPRKIFNSSPLRNSDVKLLRQRVVALFPAAEAAANELVPKGIMSSKFDTHLDESGVSGVTREQRR